MTVSEAERLYGTDQPSAESIRLTAGPLSIDLEGGAVRYVRYNGHEAIRGIDYLVRDSSWRTPPATLTTVRREESADRFVVELDGEVKQDDIHYRYRLAIEGRSAGSLDVKADAEALSGFLTNRTGFIVLHPILGVAGKPVTVTHKDGSTSETAFPELISPGQPIFDIRALRHEVAPGLHVTCRMEAALPHDPETIYEMEDQRNWTDASYKTYVGSLLDPWPYRIEAGQRIAQRISLSFEGTAAPPRGGAGGRVAIRLGEQSEGRVPEIGIGLMPEYRDSVGAAARSLRPRFITAYAETDAADFAETIAGYAALARDMGAEVQLELVLPQGKSPGTELAAAAEACAKTGLVPARVIACPAPYLKSVQPIGPWPEVVDLGHIYNQVREAFPNSVVLGGMLSYFTELNRKRPPIATIDALTCTTTPIVHAADDTSVMETNEALPAVIASMAAIAHGKPLHLGPSTIGMRHNPYGVATAPNPDRARIAMADDDPRQRALFAAAWTVAYAAAASATGSLATLAINHLAGPFAIAGEDGRPWPVFHAMTALADASGKERVPTEVDGAGCATLAWKSGAGTRLLVANLGPMPLQLSLPAGFAGRVLDTSSFDAATSDAGWSDMSGDASQEETTLGPYAVLFAHK